MTTRRSRLVACTAGIAGGAFIVLASSITAVGQVPLAALVEPLPADSPLRGRDDVIITSHLAGQTVEARAGIAAAHAVIDVLDGRQPAHPI